MGYSRLYRKQAKARFKAVRLFALFHSSHIVAIRVRGSPFSAQTHGRVRKPVIEKERKSFSFMRSSAFYRSRSWTAKPSRDEELTGATGCKWSQSTIILPFDNLQCNIGIGLPIR